jgi:hypothetical protein
MTDTSLEHHSAPSPSNPSVDDLLIRAFHRWAIVDTLAIASFDLAILSSYPFPDTIDVLRAPFYIVFGLVTLVGALALTFLGYRVVTMRVARRARSIYLIFLPAMVLFASLLGFALMTAPK